MTWSIRAAAFLSGAAVLIAEIAGARLLSPHFGSSLQVWAALITAAMLSLAAGYALGGWAADRGPASAALPRTFLLAGAALLPTAFAAPVLLKLLAPWGVPWGAFAGALLTLGPALCALGAATPIAAKAAAPEPRGFGRALGEVQALNTWGGLAGALLTGLFLLPRLGLARLFLGLGTALAVPGLLASNILGQRSYSLIVPSFLKR